MTGGGSLPTPAVTLLAPLLIAVALDLLVAEPPRRVHPVALFGRLVGPFDRDWARPGLVEHRTLGTYCHVHAASGAFDAFLDEVER